MCTRNFHRDSCGTWQDAFAAILSAILAISAQAQTWDGGGVAGGVVTWSTAANWNPDGVPANNGSANIIMAGNIDTSNTVDVSFDISSLTFNNTAGAFVLGGAGTLTVRGGGIHNNDTQTQTFNVPLVVFNNQTWNAASGNLTYLGAVNLNGNVLTLDGTGTHSLLAISSATGSIVKNGAGTVMFNSAGSFGGGFTLNAGTVQLNSATNQLGTGAVTINGGAIQGLLVSNTINNALTLGGNFATAGANPLFFNGGATLTGDRTITTDNTAITAFTGAPIGEDVAGRSLTKAGAGSLRLAGATANTYTGNTNVNAGTLRLNKPAGVNAIAGAALFIGDGAGGANADVVQLDTSNQILDTTSVVVHTSGLFNLNGFAETLNSLQMFGGNVTTSVGTLTVSSQVFHESSFNLTSTITGNLSLGGGTTAFEIENGAPASDLVVNGVISNGGVTKSLAGTLEFSGTAANTYTGTTTVTAGTLRLNKSDGVVAVAGDLAIDGGALVVNSAGQFAAATDVTMSNAGFMAVLDNNAIKSLTLDDSVVQLQLGATLTVENPISVNNTTGVSTIDDLGGGILELAGLANNISIADGPGINDLQVFAAINSTAGLTKTGAGQMMLFGSTANSIGGTMSVNEGTLVLAKNAPNVTALSGNIVVGDGIGGVDADVLRLGQSHQIAQLVTETLTVNSSGHFDLGVFNETIGNLQLNAGHVSGSGAIGFTGSVTSSAQNNTSIINANIDLLGTTTMFDVGDGLAGDDLAITGSMQNGSFSKLGPGTLRLTGGSPNSATLSQVTDGTIVLEKNAGANAVGGTQLVIGDSMGSDVLRYGANDHQLPDSIAVVVQSSGQFDLNGRNDTIGTLTMEGAGVVQTGAGTLTVGSQVLSNLSTTAGTINGNLNLGGGIRPFAIANSAIPAIDLTVTAAMSNGTLQKQGPGALALTGSALASAISYQLDDGTLSASPLVVGATRSFTQNAGAFAGTLTNHGAFTYNGGTFSGQLQNKPAGATTFNADFTAANGLTNEGSITVANGRTVTANGAGLTNDGTIVMAGGTLTAASTSNFINNELITGNGELIASSVNLVNVGDIVVSGGDLAINSNFSPINNGIIAVPNNLKLQLLGTGNMQNAGLIFLDGGKITGTSGLTNNLGGEIRGGSSVETPLSNIGGLVHATGPGTLTITALTGNSAGGELRVDDGGTMNVQSGFASSGTIVLAGANATLSGGTVTNSGTVRGAGRVSNSVANSGTIRAENGTLTLAAAGHTNTAAGRIEAGTGTQVFYSQGLASNAGQIALTGGAFDNNNAALANPGRIEGYGTVRTGGLTNTGTVSVGGSLDVLGAVTQNATVSTQTGTTVRFFGPVSGPGSYPGAGTVMFLNTFSPGASPAAVDFGGNVLFSPLATVVMELGGTTPGSQHDRLDVAGQLNFGGTLDVDLINSFVPSAGNSFDLFNWNETRGSFATLNLPALSTGLMWNTSQLYTSGILSVALSGDYNLNGVVDAADYVVWRKTLGQFGFALAADGNGNNEVDPGDYGVWRAHFGQTAGSGSSVEQNAAVPEPPSNCLFWCTAIGVLVIRRIRR